MAGMQVFSDSFRDTKVKRAPRMESEVPGDPGGPATWGSPAQADPLQHKPPHETPPHTHPKLAVLISLAERAEPGIRSFLN